ncbi:uncharacterized protein SETTUDRAFT_166205 [Exserohilum turcica Et28A]|uniref:Uncharacterized protein n=1 Tax=Exserohilum turcicum (strain 28A) TaxID=671987 RepID=R0JT93_EXST2|nr:uncharacterized protein SETTUDRAFT_166205 [Exserohilum turcica Et28A]EOA80754.1 hypothetical protein SETTUDRAFT_166205 [Exserohilum turcica Et28A]
MTVATLVCMPKRAVYILLSPLYPFSVCRSETTHVLLHAVPLSHLHLLLRVLYMDQFDSVWVAVKWI